MANIRGGPNSRMLVLGDAPITAGQVPAVFVFAAVSFAARQFETYLAFPLQPCESAAHVVASHNANTESVVSNASGDRWRLRKNGQPRRPDADVVQGEIAGYLAGSSCVRKVLPVRPKQPSPWIFRRHNAGRSRSIIPMAIPPAWHS